MARTPAQIRYYWTHQSEILRKLKVDRQNNPQKYLTKSRSHHAKNKAKLNARCAQYLATHREQINARKRRHYAANRDRILREHSERWRSDVNASRAIARQKHQKRKKAANLNSARYYREHRAEVIKQKRVYQKANPHLMREIRARRIARKQCGEVDANAIRQFEVILDTKKTIRCYWCSRRVRRSKVHIDHIVALSRGGKHAVDNLCVSCADCNLTKGSKPLNQWTSSLPQQFLPL